MTLQKRKNHVNMLSYQNARYAYLDTSIFYDMRDPNGSLSPFSKEVINMLLKACKRCGNLISYGNVYCNTCKPIVEAEREKRRLEWSKESNRRYNKKRDPKYLRFYNSNDWRTLSQKRLQDDKYKCVKCGKIASEVDHIVPIQTSKGWEHRLDYDNTQSLCVTCHNIKHNRFKKKKRPKGYF